MNELLQSITFKALYFRGNKYGQKDIIQAINVLAKYLENNIKSSSPFIVLATYNHIKTVIAYYAILKAGKIAVILDPESKTVEMAEIIEDVDPSAIFFVNNQTTKFNYEEEIIFRTQSKSFIITSDLKDVCTIGYTNAEDGYSKGAMLTEQNLLAEIQAVIQVNRITKNSVICALLPFAHLFGLIQGVLAPTHAGCHNLIKEVNLWQLEAILSDITAYRVTHFYTVPSVYYILSKCDGVDCMLEGVDEFFTGGVKLQEMVYDRFYQKTNKIIREGYGLTECSPAVSFNYDEEKPIIDSVGKALPGVEIKIVNDQGKKCGYDTKGEICVKGDIVFKGYFNHPEATKNVFDQDGWLRTGDYGMMDRQGRVYFRGLKKDMINVSGNNVYPKKLSRLMQLNSNAEEVHISKQQSVLQGETVVARVKLKDNSTEKQTAYKRWCEKNINNTLLPKQWIFE